MADSASLVVRVSAKGVGSTTRELDGLSNSALKADKSNASLVKSLRSAVPALSIVTAGAIAASGAIAAMVLSSANSERELSNLSRTAKTTKKDFAALSFVFKQYNVDAKGTADAMNDVSERLGEFAAAGSGPFQDFADVMGLTKTEAVAMANELQRLKPEEAIQRMVTAMEGANTQGAQMSFVLKSMSNDLEYASGAFADNGKVLNELKKNYSSFNDQLALTEGQAAQLQTAALSFDTLTGAFGSASKAISATLAPTMSGFFNSIIEVVPNATNTIIDFINTFNKAADIQSISQLDAQMASLADTIENGVAKGYDKMSRNMQENPLDFVRVGKYQDAVQRLSELEQQKIKITEAQTKAELELATARKGGQIGGVGKFANTGPDPKVQAEAYLESLRQSNLSELQLIDTQEAEKISKLSAFKSQGLINEQAYQDGLNEITFNSSMKRGEIELDAARVLAEEKKKLQDEFDEKRLNFEKLSTDLEAANGSELEQIRIQQDNKLAELERYHRDSIISEEEYQATKTRIQKEADKRRGETYKNALDATTANLKSVLGENNALYKASAITQTIIETYKSATSAFSALAPIPYVGPILGGIAAGAAVAAGMANVQKIRAAREQGGSMTAGSAYQMAERGKAEVIVPSGSSRARTAAQMRDIMGQNGGGGDVKAITIVNNTSGRIDSATTDMDSEGQLSITISEVVASAILSQDSQIAKAIKNTRGQPGY